MGETWAGADERQRKEWLRTGVVPMEYPAPVAADWPDLLEIVERKVRGTRAAHSTAGWWQFERYRGELYAFIKGLERVLVISRVGQHGLFSFLSPDRVYAETLVVMAFQVSGAMALLQSRVHEVWALFFASSLEERLRYGPSDCFETFPFPPGWESDPQLEEAGRTYYEFRAALMIRNQEGLTKTYNRFHDPDEASPEILKLRELHAAMDRAVLDAYGWTDIPTDCDFLLDWEDEEEEGTSSRRKKPWRLRGPDAVRDEVLARLLALNAERAAAEEREGVVAEAREKYQTKRAGRPRKVPASAQGQFDLG